MGVTSGRPETVWERRKAMIEKSRAAADRRARGFRAMYVSVGLTVAVLSTVVSTTIFASADLRYVAGVIAAVVAVLTTINSFFNPQREALRAFEKQRSLHALGLEVDRLLHAGYPGGQNETFWTEELKGIDHRYSEIMEQNAAQAQRSGGV